MLVKLKLHSKTVKMFGSTLHLLGILVGTFPALQSPTKPLTKKLVNAVIVLLVMANIDWTDGSFYIFWGLAIMTNWIFQNDIPNRLVDRMMKRSQEAIETVGDELKEQIGKVNSD